MWQTVVAVIRRALRRQCNDNGVIKYKGRTNSGEIILFEYVFVAATCRRRELRLPVQVQPGSVGKSSKRRAQSKPAISLLSASCQLTTFQMALK